MSIANTSLFASPVARKLGVGFHNIGGILRASNEAVVKQVAAHYGERCGHIPLNAEHIRILVESWTSDNQSQIDYLSQLFGKAIKAVTSADLKQEQKLAASPALIVPYVNVPEAAQQIQNELDADTWGLPAPMVNILKNKADFYQFVDEAGLDGFQTPDYRIAHIADLPKAALSFLDMIEKLLDAAALSHYPLGVMMRAAESDGNYGCCLAYVQNTLITVVPNGNAEQTMYYTSWPEALAVCQKLLAATMNPQKETRVVISRFLDIADSPGMSVVILDGQVESLHWNGQLQKKGSKACVGTSSYTPRNADLVGFQRDYEDRTATFFEAILRKTAQQCGIDFSSLRGVANIDIILPGKLESKLQQQRGMKPVLYLAECNPRWTNYTDAILTIIGASRKAQTVGNMQTVIQEGIVTIDKYAFPEHLDPRAVRECIFESDHLLRREGTRIICRMAKNPMGLIFAGDIAKAELAVATIIERLTNQKSFSPN